MVPQFRRPGFMFAGRESINVQNRVRESGREFVMMSDSAVFITAGPFLKLRSAHYCGPTFDGLEQESRGQSCRDVIRTKHRNFREVTRTNMWSLEIDRFGKFLGKRASSFDFWIVLPPMCPHHKDVVF